MSDYDDRAAGALEAHESSLEFCVSVHTEKRPTLHRIRSSYENIIVSAARVIAQNKNKHYRVWSHCMQRL